MLPAVGPYQFQRRPEPAYVFCVPVYALEKSDCRADTLLWRAILETHYLPLPVVDFAGAFWVCTSILASA